MGVAFGLSQAIESLPPENTGFLVIAPDRGYLGNEMIRSVYGEFQSLYPNSTLTFLEARSEIGEQRELLEESLLELKAKGVQEIVVIPLFISSDSFFLQRAKGLIQEFQDKTAGLRIRTAAAMAESYLTAQILLDMAQGLSEHPETEQLIVLGSGAGNARQAEGIKRDLEKLIEYVNRRMPFKETKSAVLFTRAHQHRTMREQSINEFNEMVASAAAQKERALVIPLFLSEWKSTNMMATWPRMKPRLAKMGALYSDEEFTPYPTLKPHPNMSLWLKKTAAQYLKVQKDEIGVVLIPHGSTFVYNQRIRKQVEPLKQQYKVEIAWGMADPMIIQSAVSKLERRGVKKIVVLRLFIISPNFKEKTEYILGLRETPFQFGMGMIPPQVRSSAVFASLGGFDAHPLVAEILLDRTMEISRDPASETVLLLAHGEGDDGRNEFWEGKLSSLAEQIQAKAKVKFQAVKYATLREDWPEKKEVAKQNIEKIIQEGNRRGDVLVIPGRFGGAGEYREELKGLKFTLQEKGLSPHPNIARWIEDRVQEALKELNADDIS